MKKTIILFSLAVLAFTQVLARGYNVGDRAADFRLKNVDGKYVSMSDYNDAKGFIVVFTCNSCPYAVAYEDRLIRLDKQYRDQGYPVIAINPNDPALSPADSFEQMQKRAREKAFTFPYLLDESQEVFPQYGATRTPHVFVLTKKNENMMVAYIGTIDDNYRDESDVEETYLANAIEALLAGDAPDPDYTTAIGCTIKTAN
jgi:peroxiredoxin